MRRAPVPPLAERKRPGLSVTLTGPVHPNACQSCGVFRGHVGDLERWQECDEWDKGTRVVVVLCGGCAERLIEPNHRLYRRLERNRPVLGAMDLCSLCRHRDGTRCTFPGARHNGGPGMLVTYSKPSVMFVDGTGFHGAIRTYALPPSECAGREEAANTAH